jgi:hypothetical protein
MFLGLYIRTSDYGLQTTDLYSGVAQRLGFALLAESCDLNESKAKPSAYWVVSLTRRVRLDLRTFELSDVLMANRQSECLKVKESAFSIRLDFFASFFVKKKRRERKNQAVAPTGHMRFIGDCFSTKR